MTETSCGAAPARHRSGLKWQEWLVGQALPLWAQDGFNRTTSLFHERLTFSAAPQAVPALRLMVQARQIATYCRAAVEGLYGGGEDALDGLATIERLYHRRDGEAGWIFSISPTLEALDTKRDLYAHAFIIYAYHWAFRLSDVAAYYRKARETLRDVRLIFADAGDGLRGISPGKDDVRGQDPIMHLFEACLVWMPYAEHPDFQNQAEKLARLALTRLIDPSTGMIREYFDASWQPLQAEGKNRIEPGHVFEWSWLLRNYARLTRDAALRRPIEDAAARLFEAGQRFGLQDGGVVDAISETGVPLMRTMRIWPQTEYYRLLADLRHDAAQDASERAKIESSMQNVTDLFFSRFTIGTAGGGWIDRVREDGSGCVDHMPASSLYHIYGAATAC
ncbi:MAG: AGE family epimerase/isomerase [Acetobacteraceae bacterium]